MNAVIIYLEDMDDPTKVQVSVEVIGDPDSAHVLASRLVAKLSSNDNVTLVRESVFTQDSPSKFLN